MENISEEVAVAVEKFLDSKDLNYTYDEEEGKFKLELGIKGMIKSLHYVIEIKSEIYVLYAFSPIGAERGDKATIARLAEFLCRVNDRILVGNFDIGMDNGQIAFKMYVDCVDNLPTSNVIDRSISIPAILFDRYGPGILAMIFSEVSPAEAVKLCEKKESPKDD